MWLRVRIRVGKENFALVSAYGSENEKGIGNKG